jgi:hypothetical protein
MLHLHCSAVCPFFRNLRSLILQVLIWVRVGCLLQRGVPVGEKGLADRRLSLAERAVAGSMTMICPRS